MENDYPLTYSSPVITAPSGGPLPGITPTRRTLDNRFPQLAFTIRTAGRPYYEVLLTTNAALFDPTRAAERNANNFYPARSDERRLQPALGGSAVFIAPQSTLYAFAAATPRPSAIFYTVVTYADAAGNQPAFPLPADELARHAPSVLLAADFRAETLSTILGTPVAKLRHYQPGVIPNPMSAPPVEERTNTVQDGYEHYHESSPQAAQSIAYDDGYQTPYNDGYEAYAAGAHHEADLMPPTTSSAYAGDYPGHPFYAEPQESHFPWGASEPAALQDTEEPRGGDDTDEGGEYGYDDGYGDMPTGDSDSGRGRANGHHHPHAETTPPASRAVPVGNGHDRNGPGTAQMTHGAFRANGGAYADEAEDYSYGQAFALDEAGDSFEPEIPYEPLSAELGQGAAAPAPPLTIDMQRAIIARIGRFESGAQGYSAMNRDGEFRGLFGHDHSAYNRWHVGLSYGLIQFTQDSGTLGKLLTAMRDRDAARFDAIFGPHAAELLRVTNALGPSSAEVPGGRSVRVQPVGGADLWEEPWVARFAEAGRHVPFQAAQNEMAATLYIAPVLPFASWFGLNTDRALTIVADRSVQLGPGGARRWIAGAIGPIQTVAQRQQALAALGHADLRAFQQATRGLGHDGDWGPQTHAALVGALRGLGAASPIAIPTLNQMLDTLVRRSATEPWGHRVRTLRTSTEFTDIAYSF